MNDAGKLAGKLGLDGHDEAAFADRHDVVLNRLGEPGRTQHRADAIARVGLRLRKIATNTAQRGRGAVEHDAAFVDAVGDRPLQLPQRKVPAGNLRQNGVFLHGMVSSCRRRQRVPDRAQIAPAEGSSERCRLGEFGGVDGRRHVQVGARDEIPRRRGALLFDADHRVELALGHQDLREPASALGVRRRDDALANAREIERVERPVVGEHVRPGYSSLRCSSSRTRVGSALPPEAFMICPTRNPATLVLPAR